MWYTLWSFLVGSCIELLGANLALDTFALPQICSGDPQCGTTSIVGGPVQFGDETQCYLPLPTHDPSYDWLYCQPVTVPQLNGPVDVETPCTPMLTYAQLPYALRRYFAELECPSFDASMGWCAPANVCTTADELAGHCTCTIAEQANHECTP